MSGFTPGPWGVWKGPEGETVIRAIYRDGQGRRTTAYPAVISSLNSKEPNARLIAASPDLYALAKGYEAFEADLILNGDWRNGQVLMSQDQHDWMMRLQDQRNAALAAADGKDPSK